MQRKTASRHPLAQQWRAMKELHRVSPSYFPLLTLLCIVKAISPYLTVFVTAQVLSELATLRRVAVLARWAIASVLCLSLTNLIGAVLERHIETLTNDLWGRKEILFIQKMFALDFAEVDDPKTHDLRAQIRQSEQWSGWGLMRVAEIYQEGVTGVLGLISGIVLSISLFTSPVPARAGALQLLNHPLFILIIAVVMVGVSILAGKCSAAFIQHWSAFNEDATFGNRLFSHFGFAVMDAKRAVDMRMNRQQNLVRAYWQTNATFGADGPIGKMARGKMGIEKSLGVCLTTLITGFLYVFTCLKAWAGAFDVGRITQYVGAATAMVDNIFTLTDLLGVVQANAVYLDKTFAFLDLPEAQEHGTRAIEPLKRAHEVEFRDVSFRYPDAETWALRHVNLTIHPEQRIAIVGENGSGKTTLIKLLCRLYEPQEGGIFLDGIDIQDLIASDYMALFSVVFQDFQLLSQPLGDNVAGSTDYDATRVQHALDQAGLGERVQRMPEGLDTILYKEFSTDGVEISGGEAQKIAIARALYKNAPFIILDEPTAALDPIAEAEIYQAFDEMVDGKTAIYISHRLSSCKFCDTIVVFHDGYVIQQGSHASLVQDTNGKYYALWNAQAQYYTEEAKG